MMETGGLDSQIDQRIDAYRNNPEKLQQRYAQNKELVDLLALQKLKSEKDAVARDMQMKMQQQPQTIRQQRESEMFQRTKDDMVKQTSGILAKKQGDQQKRLRKLTSGKPTAMNRPSAMQSGIAGLTGMPGMPKRPMPKRLAGGGIVGFAPGGKVSTLDKIALAQTLGETEALGLINAYEQGRISEDGFNERVRIAKKEIGGPSRGRGRSDLADFDPSSLTAGVLPTVPNTDAPNLSTPSLGISAPMKIETPDFRSEGPTTDRQIAQLDAATGREAPVPSPLRSPEKTSPTDRGIMAALQGYRAAEDAAGNVGIADSQDAFYAGAKAADKITGRAEKAQRFQDMQDKLAAFEEANYSPEQQQFERVTGILAGAGGATSLGQMGKQMTSAGINIRNRQKTKSFDRMIQAFNTEIAGMDLDQRLSTSALNTASTLFSEDQANKRASIAAVRAGNIKAFDAAIKMVDARRADAAADRAYELDERALAIKEKLANFEGLGLELRKDKLLLDGQLLDIRREELSAKLKGLDQQRATALFTSLMKFTSDTKISQADQMIAGMDAEINSLDDRLSSGIITDEAQIKTLTEELARLRKNRAVLVGSLSNAILQDVNLGGGFTMYDLQKSLLENPYIQELVNPATVKSVN
jgi:predicted GIY-YIG superfamily endonuclease